MPPCASNEENQTKRSIKTRVHKRINRRESLKAHQDGDIDIRKVYTIELPNLAVDRVGADLNHTTN
jgi:hypothetical protein